ncbi:YhbY family RNA-binding protein [soil metagenome]
MSLTSKQRSHLRSLAHALKPVHQIGKEGVTENASKSVRDALRKREIIKVRVLDGAPESPREAAEKLAADIIELEVVQVMGRTLTLYRPHPDIREVVLPK